MPEDHCSKHEENTNDIAAIKANSRLLKWIIPIGIAMASGVVSFVINQTNENVKAVNTTVYEVKTIVQTAAISAAVDRARLDRLERELERR